MFFLLHALEMAEAVLCGACAQIEQWLAVQNLWMYVEAVFSGGDIVKQLPIEAKRFQNIDKSFTKVGTHEKAVPLIMEYLHAPTCLRSSSFPTGQ